MPWEKQFNKSEALDRAMQTFWMRGYEATSMQELVDRTGVNRGSLYATYGDKRALFLASLRSYDERRRSLLGELERRLPWRDAIRRAFANFLDEVTPSGPNRGCFLTNTALELAAQDPEVRRTVANAQEEVEGFFLRMIERGKSSGEVAASVDSHQSARALLAALLGILVLVRSRPDPVVLQAVVEDAIRRLG